MALIHQNCQNLNVFFSFRYKSKNLEGILELQNKTPVWNDETQSYVLNFHGRVTQVGMEGSNKVSSVQLLYTDAF